MAKYLVIVESPAKAKTIKKYLGKNYKVLASMGHLRDLPKSKMGVDIENDFKPQYITIRGKGQLLGKLKKEAKNSNKVYLATDPDREGEAISWHLARVMNLEDKTCRITFNEITKTAVKDAIKNPRTIDYDLVNAQQARRILDRIVGYKISPLLWKKVRKGLSAGRVQSVATKLICDREEEINAFIPKEYWTIISKFYIDKNKTFEAKFYGTINKKMELPNKETVDGIIHEIDKKDYIVKNVTTGEKKKNPYPPFITSTLQQESAKKLGFSSKRTMMIAQQLYEGIDIKEKGPVGLITYMRTDSTRISSEAQEAVRKYISSEYGTNYLPKVPRKFKTKKGAQDAHEAIRPTDIFLTPDVVKDSLQPVQYKLYKLIWERFIASQMESAIYDTLKISIQAGSYIFKASGSKIRFLGYMAVYKYEKNENKGQMMPELKKGQKLDLKEIIPEQHFTQPPARYNEATLIKTLEEKGIGRPSTYAPTISTIMARGYVEKEKKYLKPTELGIVINDVMKVHFEDIVDVGFTANMEELLDEVEEGKKNWVEVLKNFYYPFDITFKKAEEEMKDIEIKDEVTDIICEKCGRNMVIKMGRYGKFLACPGFPECRNTKPIFEEADIKCPLCGGKIFIKKTRKGKRYYACENNPECKLMTWNKPSGELCPKCNSVMVVKSNKVKCTNNDCGYERSSKK